MDLLVSLDREADGTWTVETPPISRLVRKGKTREEALENVENAIRDHLKLKVEGNLSTGGALFREHAESPTANNSDVAEKFAKLVREWKETRPPTSNSDKLAMHPAYQKIIGLGPIAIPLILRELNQSLSHWFWALHSLTDENPVRPEHRGNLRKMADDWFEWARERGYRWN